jgi:hypothetical protein
LPVKSKQRFITVKAKIEIQLGDIADMPGETGFYGDMIVAYEINKGVFAHIFQIGSV